VVIIFGVSFQELSDLQGPLASLNVAAHVMYRVARLRAQLSQLAFELDPAVTETLRTGALDELGLLRREYETLLYGGRVLTLVGGGGRLDQQHSSEQWYSHPYMPCVYNLCIPPGRDMLEGYMAIHWASSVHTLLCADLAVAGTGAGCPQAEVSFDFIAPAGAFASADFANLFFKTTQCLRFDLSTCFTQDSKYYDVTHHGLDAIMSRCGAEPCCLVACIR
jgi:hypothetical protein